MAGGHRIVRLKHGKRRIFADVVDVYGTRNEFGYDGLSATIVQGRLIVTKTSLKMLPIVPGAGLNCEC
jgi:hypothetical protein